jgi:hypothetical protein
VIYLEGIEADISLLRIDCSLEQDTFIRDPEQVALNGNASELHHPS